MPPKQFQKRNSDGLTVKLVKWCMVLLLLSWAVPQTEAVCNGDLDLVFILDVSASFQSAAIDAMRTLVTDMAGLFNESVPGNFRMGTIWYAANVYNNDIIHLTDNQGTALSRIQNFDRTTQMNFYADTAKALDRMMVMFNDEGDNSSTWASILVTDSISSNQSATETVANALEGTRIHVFPVGVGTLLMNDQTELKKIATGTIQPVVVPALPSNLDNLTDSVCAVTQTNETTNGTKEDAAVDLYFVLEESEQVLPQDYELMKDYVKMILRRFEIGDLSAKVGVINYAQQVLQAYVVPFGEHLNESELFTAIDNLNYNPFNTGRDLNSALSELTQSINNNSIPERPVVTIVFSTGLSENSANAVIKAEALKARENPNINFIVVGVAASDTPSWTDEQSRIASDSEAIFRPQSFTELVSEMGDNSTLQMIKAKVVQFAQGRDVSVLLPPFDVVFAIDGSGLVGPEFDFPLFLTLVGNLIDSFDLESGVSRIGLLLFDGAGTYTTIHLGDYLDKQDLINQINSLIILNRTASADNAIALRDIRAEFAANSRQGTVSKLGYLITKSPSPYPLLVQVHARAALYEEGIQTLILGVDNIVDSANMMALQEVLTKPEQGAPPALRLSSRFQLGTLEMLSLLQGDLQYYSGFALPRGNPLPWDAAFDLIILVHDEAGRVDTGLGTKNFLNSLLLRFMIGMEKVRVGVVTFGANLNTGPNKMIELGIRDEIGPLVLAISTLSLVPSGGPNVLSAMDEMILMFQRNPRPGVSKLALLIVEGTPTDIQPQDFNKATDAGISMLTLGVGSQTDPLILESLAYNRQLSYLQPVWNELSVTARMIADINALAEGVFVPDLRERPLSLSAYCRHPAGIVFLMDTSNSILDILDKVKNFIGILFSGFDLSEVDIGVVGFGSYVHPDTLITLGSINNYAQLYVHFHMTMQAVLSDYGTGTGVAIEYMRTQMFNGTTYEKKIGVVVTDGRSENPSQTMMEAKSAIAEGIKMITIGVGADMDEVFMTELQDITDDNQAVFSFSSTDFNSNEILKPKLESVAQYICQVSKPPVTCDPGTYYDAVTDSCHDCERGTYQGLSNQTSCTACPQGFTTPGTGATSISDCMDPCDSGKTYDGSMCVPCGYGNYRNKTLYNLCQSCQSLFTTLTDTAEDESACVPDCAAGYEWNDTLCTPCPVDFYQPEPNQYDCLPCPVGYTAPSNGSTACDPICPNGDYVVCPSNPCDSVQCLNYPSATCSVNHCGSCTAVFMDNGTDVTDRCSVSPLITCAEPMDLLLVVDNTDSIDDGLFNLVKIFLKNLVDSLDIGPNKIRVGLVPSGGFTGSVPLPSPLTHLNDTNMTQDAIKSAIDTLALVPFPRSLAVAMGTAVPLVQNEGRDGVPKLMLLVTYGTSENQFQTKVAAAVGVHSGIDAIAVGVGPNYDLGELTVIAKDASSIVTTSLFTTLSSLDLSTPLCSAAQSYEETTVELTGACSSPLDMVFLMDVSNSFNASSLTWMKIAIANIAQQLEIGLDKVRIGIISFAAEVNVNASFPLNASVNYDAVTASLDAQVGNVAAGTATGPALMKALEFFQSARLGVPRVLITVTDGASDNPSATMSAAQEIHDNHIYSLVVELGSMADDTEIQAIATNPDAVLSYPSAIVWNAALSDVFDKICPIEYECSSAMDVGFVWNIDSKDVMVSALGMTENFIESFNQPDVVVKTVFTEDHGSVEAAVAEAQSQLEGTQRTDVVKLLLILTDRDVTSPQALQVATNSAKNSGIIVGVLNAKQSPNVDWNVYASDPRVVFEIALFDDAQYERFIHNSFCIATCPSGTEVDSSLTQACTPCPQGQYRDSAESYQCVPCPANMSTVGDRASSLSQCNIEPLTPCTTKMDLVLVVDTTDTISETDFGYVKTFLQISISSLDIGPANIHIGLIPIPLPTATLHLNDTNMSPPTVDSAIGNLSLASLPRDTHFSLAGAIQLLDNEGRADTPRIMLFVTYGPSVNAYQTKIAAAVAAFTGTDIIAVGVGPDYDLAEITFIAKDSSTVVTEAAFSGLPSVDVSGLVCDAAQNYVFPGTSLTGACPNSVDIVVLMDVSDSFTENDLIWMKLGVLTLASRLDIGQGKVRIGVLSFDSDVNGNESLSLSASVDYDAVSNSVQAQNGGPGTGANLGEGILAALTLLEASGPGVPQVLITITDGTSDNPALTVANSQQIHSRYIYSIVVVLGETANDSEIQAIATDSGAILTYASANDWAINANASLNLLDRICPNGQTGGEYQCSAPIDITFLWDTQEKDNMVSALSFSQNLRQSFTDLSPDVVFYDEAVMTSLASAVTEAQSRLDLTARSDVVKIMLILTDQNVTDTAALQLSTDTAKDDGIIVAVLNANPNPNVNWSSYASHPDVVYNLEQFDDRQFLRFIHESLCRASCASGFQVDGSLTQACTACAQGMYRFRMDTYQCVACPAGTGTPGEGTVNSSDCNGCQPGTYWNGATCLPCPEGLVEPNSYQLQCTVSCPFGSERNTDRTACSEICPEGQEFNNVTDECDDCPRGTYKPAGVAACIECPGSFTTVAPRSTSLEQCVPDCDQGQQWNDVICVDCPYGYFQPLPYSPLPCEMCPAEFPISTADRTECLSGTFRFSQDNYSVSENAGVVSVDVVLETFSFSSPSLSGGRVPALMPEPVVVEYETQEGSAKAGVDFIHTAGTLEFEPGETRMTITVSIIDNNLFEPNKDFRIVLRLPLSGPQLEIANPSTATVIIIDVDELTLKFGSDKYTVLENAGQLTVAVRLETYLSQADAAALGTVSVNAETIDGTAIAGTDYSAVTTTVTFDVSAGQYENTISVPILDDGLMGPNRVFYISLMNPSTGTILGTPSTAMITILNDDGSCPPGAFQNLTSSQCQICPVGTYSVTPDSLTCTACPTGTTTPTEGATGPDACTGGETCKPCIDLVIAVDLSNSFIGNECACLKEFLTTLLYRLHCNERCSRTGIIKYAKAPVCVIRLRDGYIYRRLSYQVSKHMRKISDREDVNTCAGLRAMETMFQKERRRGVPLKGLLITDGVSDNLSAAVGKANSLKSKGVDLTVIGTNTTEVEQLASDVGFVISDYCGLPDVDAVINTFC